MHMEQRRLNEGFVFSQMASPNFKPRRALGESLGTVARQATLFKNRCPIDQLKTIM